MEIRNKNADPDAKQLPAIIHPNVVVSPHPISSALGRQLFYADFVMGECLLDYLDRTTLLPPVAIQDNFVLSYNGRIVTFDDAKSIFPMSGDMVVIRARVHGGGDSNPLMVVLMIAVMIASQGTAAAWVGVMTGTSMAVGSAVVLIGGMLLISALVPVKVPSIDDSAPDPTYALSGSSNRARPYEPLPVAFGTVRMYPDHGARPYTAYEENDQKLIQIFNFGLSNPTLSDLKIGDAPLEDFIGVDYEISPGTTGALTLAPTNVDTLAGANLSDNAGVFIERTSSLNTTRLVVDVSGIQFYIDPDGQRETRLELTIEYRVSGSSGAWLPFFRKWDGITSIIPLVINWVDSATTFIHSTDKELGRFSFHRTVAEGQYEVRVKLTDNAWLVNKYTSCDDEGENCTQVVSYVPFTLEYSKFTHVMAFDQLKSYQPDTGDYSDQKRVAIEIRANAQLNGVIDSFNAIVSVAIPTWTGVAWVDAVSSNPAWQFLALARGKFDASGRRIYGAGLDDTRIDIETIKLWGAWCDAKSLECNIVFTGKLTVIDMMNTVARVGRGVSTWSNGSLGVVYDEANKVAVSMFGMSNIVHDSFKVNYVSNNQIDEVIVAFSNPDLGWTRDTVRVLVPGVVTPINSVTIELPGITDEAQAAKEANLIAAEQFYRRRIMTWESDIEGLTVQRGDVAILSHDITQWDYSGRLISGTTTTLSLDRDITFDTTGYIGIRHPDGTYEIVDVATFTGDQSVILLITPLSVSPDADVLNSPDDYLWFYGPSATPGKLVKITDITPLSEDRIRIVATDEDDDYYLSESDSYTYLPPQDALSRVPIISGLALGETLVLVGSGFGSRVDVSWDVEGEYGGAFIRAGDEDNKLKDIGRTLDKRFSFEWPIGKTVTVEVTVHNQNYEISDVGRATESLLLVGKMKLPENVANFSALQNGAAVVIRWTPAADIDLAGTEIRYGLRGESTWEDATPLTEVTKGTNITSQALPDGDWTVYAKHRDTSLNYSAIAAESDVLFSSDQDIILQVEQSPDWVGVLDRDIYYIADTSNTIFGNYAHTFIDIDGTLDIETVIYIEKDSVPRATRFSSFSATFTGGTTPEGYLVKFDSMTGEYEVTVATPTVVVTTVGDLWKFAITHSLTDTTNNLVSITVRPAHGASATWVTSGSTLGTVGMSTPLIREVGGRPNVMEGLATFADFETENGATQTPNTDLSFGFVVHHTGKLVPKSLDPDSTDSGTVLWAEDTVFENYVVNPYPVCTYVSPEIDSGFDDTVRMWGDIRSALGPGETGVANPLLEIDYRLDAGAYDGFEPWTIGNATLRYSKFKVVLDTGLGNAYLSGFNPTVDLLERTDKQEVTITAGGTIVTFTNPFHIPPFGSADGVTVDSGTLAYATITNITTTQALVHVYNTSGTSAGGDAVITLTGV